MRSQEPASSVVVSRHRFTRPRIRLWLPLLMWGLVILCASASLPRIRVVEVLGLFLVVGIAISAMVPICEITVTQSGLIIHRLVLRDKFIPWNAIDRVLVYRGDDTTSSSHRFEITSIGIFEGLSLLNLLPGLLYGQGLRQTIIVVPDVIQDYDGLIDALARHCAVFRSHHV